MLANLTNTLDFHAKALVLRAERQRVIASNIANADTPGYVGRDINFKEAMNAATENSSRIAPFAPSGNTGGTGNARHIPLQASTTSLGSSALAYTTQTQPAMDGNSVDMDRERANFVDNSVRYEATLRFLSGRSKTILSAIQGQ
jgi:flagellar basal-body rod protein FlgB